VKEDDPGPTEDKGDAGGGVARAEKLGGEATPLVVGPCARRLANPRGDDRTWYGAGGGLGRPTKGS
jgi:hypothetical protein